MNNPLWLDGFAGAQRRRGLRPNTIRRRATVLKAFLSDVDPTAADTETLEAWLDARDLSPGARNTYAAYLKAFYAWAVKDGRAESNPAADVVRARLPRMVPRPISDEDLAEALRQAPSMLRAWLSLAAYEGLRCFEIARLRREDVLDTHDPPMLIVSDGKGGHQRVLPLHPEVGTALRICGLRGGWLFLTHHHRPYHEDTVSRKGNRYLHGLGISDTMHQLRHWFGTSVYAHSRDLRLTQELMGHASPITTAGYAAWATAEAYDVVGKLAVKQPEPTLRLFSQGTRQ